jgi:hypothetical protein
MVLMYDENDLRLSLMVKPSAHRSKAGVSGWVSLLLVFPGEIGLLGFDSALGDVDASDDEGFGDGDALSQPELNKPMTIKDNPNAKTGPSIRVKLSIDIPLRKLEGRGHDDIQSSLP